MREKLIELLGDMHCGHLDFEGCETCDYRFEEACHAKAYADHLLANGVIVLPCKAGDTVYVVDKVWKKIYVKKVDAITITEHELYISSFSFSYPRCMLGKTVFLTREEAEAALKKGEK